MIYIHIYEFAIRMRAGVYKLMNNCLDRRVLVVPLPSRFRASRHHPRSILIFTTTIKKIELETKKTFVESCVAFDPSKSAANSKASRGERERGREISWISELLLNVKVAHLQLFCAREYVCMCAWERRREVKC